MVRNVDYVPRRDADFDNWQASLHEYASTNLTGYISTNRLAEWTRLKQAWEASYAKVKGGDGKSSEKLAKSEARDDLEGLIRDVVKKALIVATSVVTDEVRRKLGLTVYTGARVDRVIGHQTPGLLGKEVGRTHELSFFRPDDVNHRGVIPEADGVEIYWKKGGEASTNIADYTFLVAIRRSPHVVEFEPEDATTLVHYVSRWYNSKGEKGPWSNFVTLVVGV